MTGKLFRQAIVKFLSGVVLLGLLLFLPAGTFRFRNAWILMGILFIPMAAAGIVMMLRSPELLRKRLNMQETEREQKTVIALSGAMFAAAFITAGLNFRFGWFVLPDAAMYIAAGFFLAGYLLFAEVLRENAYLSRTVEVQQEQKVIDTGLYGIVRHPMYSATLLLFLSMGPVLGSPVSFVILLLYIPIIVRRIRNEEAVLTEGLDGYAAYCQKVRYRLIPLIW
ncbi:MAG: isoprenylcysteine carboxylmethyltransferase family protein [Oscillospiraceae bacterium]|nr:isoprenylcysteine carboxylmethyltransferase family protein [Oscillospiraceae bacterium]